MRLLLLIAGLLAIPCWAIAAGPRVHIVLGEKAPALQRLAAEELTGTLRRLYQADVQMAATAPADATHVILVASPDSDARVREPASNWPQLSDQGLVVRTVKYRGRPALLVGGGSPVATYWAACEFGHRLGIRTLLYGDIDPVAPPEFSLAGYDLILEPTIRSRAWQTIDDLPSDTASWGLAEHRRVLKQLAKLKFNRVILTPQPWQPFAHFELQGVKKQTGVLWQGEPLRVSGETAGRSVFAGAKVFENPDFAGCETYEQRLAAGQKLIRGIIDAAHELGMSVGLKVDPLPLPAEFADLAKDPQAADKLALVQLQAYRETYLQLDALDLAASDSPKSRLLLVGNEHGGVLPQAFHKAVSTVVGAVREKAGDGFSLASAGVGELDLPAYLLSRASFGEPLPFDKALGELVTPICGEGVSERVLKAAELMERATELTAQHDLDFSRPVQGVVLKQYGSDEPPPAWWAQAKECYLGAMNEMYRANTRAREGGRSYTLYLARRCEFGMEYLNCVEAVRKAGLAKRRADHQAQIAELQKAVESLHGGLNALAAVARSSSDRGVIAALNEYGYRPLMKELEAAEEAAAAK